MISAREGARALVRWLLPAVVPVALAAQQPTVVILVRHAERAAEPAGDPGLSPQGEARAAALATALGNAGLEGIITTQYERSRATARPLAGNLNLTPEVVRAGGAAHPAAVAELVRGRFSGRTVLVVGHSNTVPAIIGALGGPRLPDLCDGEFSRLFVLVMRTDGSTSLVDGRVGNPDAPGAGECPRPERD